MDNLILSWLNTLCPEELTCSPSSTLPAHAVQYILNFLGTKDLESFIKQFFPKCKINVGRDSILAGSLLLIYVGISKDPKVEPVMKKMFLMDSNLQEQVVTFLKGFINIDFSTITKDLLLSSVKMMNRSSPLPTTPRTARSSLGSGSEIDSPLLKFFQTPQKKSTRKVNKRCRGCNALCTQLDECENERQEYFQQLEQVRAEFSSCEKKFQQRILNMEENQKSLETELMDKTEEIKCLLSRIETLNTENQVIRDDLTFVQKSLTEAEEFSKLPLLDENVNDQLLTLKNNFETLQRSHDNSLKENIELKTLLHDKEAELQDFKRCTEATAFERRQRQLDIEKMDEQFMLLSSSMNETLNLKQTELEKLIITNRQHELKIEELDIACKKYREDGDEQEKILNSLHIENEVVKDKLSRKEQEVSELQNDKMLLKKDVEDKNNSYFKLRNDLSIQEENFKKEVSELKDTNADLQKLLQDKEEHTTNLLLEKENILRRYEEQLRERDEAIKSKEQNEQSLIETIKKKECELEKAKAHISVIQAEVEKINTQFSKDMEKLKTILSKKESEIINGKERIVQLDQLLSAKEKKLKSLENDRVKTITDLEAKTSECLNILEESARNSKAFETKLLEKEQYVSNLVNYLKNMKRTLREQESMVKELNSSLIKKDKEFTRLEESASVTKMELNEKNIECETLERNLQSASDQLSQIKINVESIEDRIGQVETVVTEKEAYNLLIETKLEEVNKTNEDLSDKLSKSEMDSIHAKQGFQVTLDNLKSHLANVAQDFEDAQKSIVTYRETEIKIMDQLKSNDKELIPLKDNVSGLIEKINVLNKERDHMDQEMFIICDDLEAARKRSASLEDKIKENEKSILSLSEELSSVTIIKTQLEQKLVDTETKCSVLENKTKLLEVEIKENEEQISSLREELISVITVKTELGKKLQDTESKCIGLDNKTKLLEDELKENEELILSLREELSSVTINKTDLEQKLLDTETRIAEEKEEVIQTMQDKVDKLQDMMGDRMKLSEEAEQLRAMNQTLLKEKNQLILQMKTSLSEKMEEIRKIMVESEEKTVINCNLEQQFKNLTTECDKLKVVLSEKDCVVSDLRNQITTTEELSVSKDDKINSLNDNLIRSQADLKEAVTLSKALEKDNSNLHKKLGILIQDKDKMAEVLSSTSQQIGSLTVEKEELEGKVVSFKHEILALQNNDSKSKAEIQQLKEIQSVLEEKNKLIAQELNNCLDQNKLLVYDQSLLEEKHRLTKEKLDQCLDLNRRLACELENKKGDSEATQRNLIANSTALDEAMQKIKQLVSSHESLRKEITDVAGNKLDIQNALEKQTSRNASLEMQLKETKNKCDSLSVELANSTVQLESMKSAMESIKSQQLELSSNLKEKEDNIRSLLKEKRDLINEFQQHSLYNISSSNESPIDVFIKLRGVLEEKISECVALRTKISGMENRSALSTCDDIVKQERIDIDLSDSLEEVPVPDKTFEIVNLHNNTYSMPPEVPRRTNPNETAWVVSPPSKKKTVAPAQVHRPSRDRSGAGEAWVIPFGAAPSKPARKDQDHRGSREISRSSDRLNEATLSKERDALRKEEAQKTYRENTRSLDRAGSQIKTLETNLAMRTKERDALNRENNSLRKIVAELQSKIKKEREISESTKGATRQKYEKQLEHMKTEMKHLYNQEMRKQKEEHAKVISTEKAALQELREQNKMYKEHIDELRNQLWELGEKLLEEQNAKKGLSSQLDRLTLLPPDSWASRSGSDSKRSADEATSYSNRQKSALFPPMPVEDEDEIFDNRCLEDLKAGRMNVENPSGRLTELQIRNSLCPPHLKSTYPAETQCYSPSLCADSDLRASNMFLPESQSLTDSSDPSMTRSLIPVDKNKKKEQTSYKRPGPPTPSKNGRPSLQGGEVLSKLTPKIVLREQNAGAPRTPTSRLRALFSNKGYRRESTGSRDENVAPTTPRGKGLRIFQRKPFGGRDF